MLNHISYSALKVWSECPYKMKLGYVDRIRGPGSIHTAFGTSVHKSTELKSKDSTVDEISIFKKTFEEEIEKLLKENVELSQKDVDDFTEQGVTLAPLIIPELKRFFGEYELYSAEEALYEEIKEFTGNQFFFKGFIDSIIKTSDGKYHILDFKTSSWGWDHEKKSDPMITYQLTLYKKFFAQKYGIDEKDIETYFCIIKRTVKKDHIEVFRVTSGPKKTENALKVLNNCLSSVNKSFFPKNRMSCKYCEYYKKECK